MADNARLQDAEREAAFFREAALTVPSGAHIQKAIDTAVVAERMRLAANDGDDAFYDGGACSVCLASRSDGVHRDDCPVVALRAALQQAWDENTAFTRDAAKLEAAAQARLASRHSASCDLIVHPDMAEVIFPCSCGHDRLWTAMGCPEIGTSAEDD